MTKSEHHFGSQVEHHLCTSERLLGTPNLAGSGNILHDPASRHSAVTLERSKHVHKGTLMRYNQEGQSLYLVTGLPGGPGRNQQFELRPGGRNELSVRTTRGGRKSFILRTCMVSNLQICATSSPSHNLRAHLPYLSVQLLTTCEILLCICAG